MKLKQQGTISVKYYYCLCRQNLKILRTSSAGDRLGTKVLPCVSEGNMNCYILEGNQAMPIKG